MKRCFLICDVDGTLIDSMPYLRELGAVMLATAASIPHSTALYHYDQTVGLPYREQLFMWNQQVMRAKPSLSQPRESCVEWESIGDLYERMHAKIAPLFQLTSFGTALAQRMILHPRLKYLRLGMVSSTHQNIIDSLPVTKIMPWDRIRGYNGTDWFKTNQIEAIIREYNIDQDRVFYVGDSPSDRRIALNLGINFFDPVPESLETIWDAVECLTA